MGLGTQMPLCSLWKFHSVGFAAWTQFWNLIWCLEPNKNVQPFRKIPLNQPIQIKYLHANSPWHLITPYLLQWKLLSTPRTYDIFHQQEQKFDNLEHYSFTSWMNLYIIEHHRYNAYHENFQLIHNQPVNMNLDYCAMTWKEVLVYVCRSSLLCS